MPIREFGGEAANLTAGANLAEVAARSQAVAQASLRQTMQLGTQLEAAKLTNELRRQELEELDATKGLRRRSTLAQVKRTESAADRERFLLEQAQSGAISQRQAEEASRAMTRQLLGDEADSVPIDGLGLQELAEVRQQFGAQQAIRQEQQGLADRLGRLANNKVVTNENEIVGLTDRIRSGTAADLQGVRSELDDIEGEYRERQTRTSTAARFMGGAADWSDAGRMAADGIWTAFADGQTDFGDAYEAYTQLQRQEAMGATRFAQVLGVTPEVAGEALDAFLDIAKRTMDPEGVVSAIRRFADQTRSGSSFASAEDVGDVVGRRLSPNQMQQLPAASVYGAAKLDVSETQRRVDAAYSTLTAGGKQPTPEQVFQAATMAVTGQQGVTQDMLGDPNQAMMFAAIQKAYMDMQSRRTTK